MHHPPASAEADPEETERAREQWHWFTGLVKTSIATVIVVLVLLAWITL